MIGGEFKIDALSNPTKRAILAYLWQKRRSTKKLAQLVNADERHVERFLNEMPELVQKGKKKHRITEKGVLYLQLHDDILLSLNLKERKARWSFFNLITSVYLLLAFPILLFLNQLVQSLDPLEIGTPNYLLLAFAIVMVGVTRVLTRLHFRSEYFKLRLESGIFKQRALQTISLTSFISLLLVLEIYFLQTEEFNVSLAFVLATFTSWLLALTVVLVSIRRDITIEDRVTRQLARFEMPKTYNLKLHRMVEVLIIAAAIVVFASILHFTGF